MEEVRIERLAHATASGPIEACVWKSLTTAGPDYRFTLHRPYRGADDAKHSPAAFHADDAQAIIEVVKQVVHWIRNEKATIEARIRLAGQRISVTQLAVAAEEELLED